MPFLERERLKRPAEEDTKEEGRADKHTQTKEKKTNEIVLERDDK